MEPIAFAIEMDRDNESAKVYHYGTAIREITAPHILKPRKALFVDYDRTILTDDIAGLTPELKHEICQFMMFLRLCAQYHGYELYILTLSEPGWVKMSAKLHIPEVWEKHLQHIPVIYAVEHFTDLQYAKTVAIMNTMVGSCLKDSHIVGIGDNLYDRDAILLQLYDNKKSVLLASVRCAMTMYRQQQNVVSLLDRLLMDEGMADIRLDKIYAPPMPMSVAASAAQAEESVSAEPVEDIDVFAELKKSWG